MAEHGSPAPKQAPSKQGAAGMAPSRLPQAPEEARPGRHLEAYVPPTSANQPGGVGPQGRRSGSWFRLALHLVGVIALNEQRDLVRVRVRVRVRGRGRGRARVRLRARVGGRVSR